MRNFVKTVLIIYALFWSVNGFGQCTISAVPNAVTMKSIIYKNILGKITANNPYPSYNLYSYWTIGGGNDCYAHADTYYESVNVGSAERLNIGDKVTLNYQGINWIAKDAGTNTGEYYLFVRTQACNFFSCMPVLKDLKWITVCKCWDVHRDGVRTNLFKVYVYESSPVALGASYSTCFGDYSLMLDTLSNQGVPLFYFSSKYPSYNYKTAAKNGYFKNSSGTAIPNVISIGNGVGKYGVGSHTFLYHDNNIDYDFTFTINVVGDLYGAPNINDINLPSNICKNTSVAPIYISGAKDASGNIIGAKDGYWYHGVNPAINKLPEGNKFDPKLFSTGSYDLHFIHKVGACESLPSAGKTVTVSNYSGYDLFVGYKDQYCHDEEMVIKSKKIASGELKMYFDDVEFNGTKILRNESIGQHNLKISYTTSTGCAFEFYKPFNILASRSASLFMEDKVICDNEKIFIPNGGSPSSDIKNGRYFVSDSIYTITAYLNKYIDDYSNGLKSGKFISIQDKYINPPGQIIKFGAYLGFNWGSISMSENIIIKKAVLKLKATTTISANCITLSMIKSTWTSAPPTYVWMDNKKLVQYENLSGNAYDIEVDITDWATIWYTQQRENNGIYIKYADCCINDDEWLFNGITGVPANDARIEIQYHTKTQALNVDELTKISEGVYDDKKLLIGYQVSENSGCISKAYDTLSVKYCPVNLDYIGDYCQSDAEFEINKGTPAGGEYKASPNKSGDTTWIYKNNVILSPSKAGKGKFKVYYMKEVDGDIYTDTNYVTIKASPSAAVMDIDSIYCKNESYVIKVKQKQVGDTIYFYQTDKYIKSDTQKVYLDSTDFAQKVRVYNSSSVGHCYFDTTYLLKVDKVNADFTTNYRKIDPGDFLTFENKSALADSFKWEFFDGSASESNQKNPTWYYTKKGVYDVRLIAISKAGCSDTITKVGYTLVGMSLYDNSTKINVYPNPVVEGIFIQGIESGKVLQIYDMNGVKRKEIMVVSDITRIDLSELSAGAYIISVLGENKKVQFVKQ